MIINNKNEMINFAKKIAKSSKNGDIICLVGDLSAGKTFFCKYFIEYFGVNSEIISPTFNYIKNYKITNNKKIKNIYHFDAYRIKYNEMLLEIGFYDYIYDKDSICLIEWADLIKNEIPKTAKWININIIDKNKREIVIN